MTQDAINVLGIPGQITVEAIDRALSEDSEHQEDKLSAYDARYYEMAGDLADPLLAFIRRNKDKVVLR